MHAAALQFELYLRECRSLKAKRSVVRPIVDGLRRRYRVSSAEVARQDSWQQAVIGIAAVAPSHAHLIDAIVAFLETLTDERVLYRRAPFDHPQLFVPNGHPGDSTQTTDSNGDGLADDQMIMIPAVGAEGGPPLPGFLEGVFGP